MYKSLSCSLIIVDFDKPVVCHFVLFLFQASDTLSRKKCYKEHKPHSWGRGESEGRERHFALSTLLRCAYWYKIVLLCPFSSVYNNNSPWRYALFALADLNLVTHKIDIPDYPPPPTDILFKIIHVSNSVLTTTVFIIWAYYCNRLGDKYWPCRVWTTLDQAVNIYCRLYWAHALIRHYLRIGRKYAFIKNKKYALHKHVRLLTRLYGMLFIALLLASYIHVCDAILYQYLSSMSLRRCSTMVDAQFGALLVGCKQTLNCLAGS